MIICRNHVCLWAEFIHRLTGGKSDPVETDLDYYAKPENYTGSNLHAMQRVMFVQKRQNSATGANRQKDDPLDKLKERYKDIGRTGTPDSLDPKRTESRVSFADDACNESHTPSRKKSAGSRSVGETSDVTSIGRPITVPVPAGMGGCEEGEGLDAMSEGSMAQEWPMRKMSLTSQPRLSGVNGGPYRLSRASVPSSAALREFQNEMVSQITQYTSRPIYNL